MVKAAGGGGGMGLRRVERPEDLAGAIADAQAQCLAAFGSAELYWESYLVGGRHIEVQIAADTYGRTIALGERECSIQRRYQKIVEESPSPALTEADRTKLFAWAVQAAESVGYINLGTVEFLWTPERGPVFLEMNTRLQVEHPVTELVTGLDLPQLQLRLAAGERLADLVPSVDRRGWAIEVRLYAEDPQTGAPSPGRIDHLRWPTGPWVRVDAGVEAGMEVSPYYDPLLAKLITWGPDRPSAVRRMADALSRTVVAGTLTTNMALLRAIVADEAFVAGEMDTQFLAKRHVTPLGMDVEEAAIGAFLGQSSPAPTAVSASAADNWARRRWR
jgi:acetyl/propionyl-CoA carboxylase alpha subunit